MTITFNYIDKTYRIKFSDDAQALLAALMVVIQTPIVGTEKTLQYLTEMFGGTIEDNGPPE